MSSELISIYLYSTIAQTLGALIGIGIIVLTFQAQWSNNRRRELQEHLRRLGNELAKDVGGLSFDNVGSDHTLISRLKELADDLRDSDTRKSEVREYLRLYRDFKPVISSALFIIGLVVSLTTAGSAIVCIFLIEHMCLLYSMFILVGFAASLVIYFILALKIARSIKKDLSVSEVELQNRN
jgi:ABC-type multidrug transport system fused ATPase/permease subunit